MSKKSIIAWASFFIILILIVDFFTVDKEYVYIDDLTNISAPIQSEASGGFDLKKGSWNVDITYVAEYEVSGKVVNIHDYKGSSLNDKLSPVDVGLTWGELANDNQVRWYSTGNRFLYWKASYEVINKLGGEDIISEQYSNNHLIPANDEIEKLVKEIEEDDYVTIKGYLVNMYATKSDGSYRYWNSSTSRKDTGDGACELIYVEDVKWLKEK